MGFQPFIPCDPITDFVMLATPHSMNAEVCIIADICTYSTYRDNYEKLFVYYFKLNVKVGAAYSQQADKLLAQF